VARGADRARRTQACSVIFFARSNSPERHRAETRVLRVSGESDTPRERRRGAPPKLIRSRSDRIATSVGSYQGIPLRSGTLAVDCSGSPPAMRISAMSRMPVNPPPTNATINHQAETICRPRFPWSRRHPGFSCSATAARPPRFLLKKIRRSAGPFSACLDYPPGGIAPERHIPLRRLASNKLNSTARSSVRTNCRRKGSTTDLLISPFDACQPHLKPHCTAPLSAKDNSFDYSLFCHPFKVLVQKVDGAGRRLLERHETTGRRCGSAPGLESEGARANIRGNRPTALETTAWWVVVYGGSVTRPESQSAVVGSSRTWVDCRGSSPAT
jgi:hypothetical protein